MSQSQQTFDTNPWTRELGVELLQAADGKASITLALEPRHMNNWEAAHGGVILTMLDVVMSLAGRSLDPQAKAGVTVELKTSFMQPAGAPGDVLVGHGKVTHKSISLCFCEGELWCGERLVAKAMGTFMYMRRMDVARKLEHS